MQMPNKIIRSHELGSGQASESAPKEIDQVAPAQRQKGMQALHLLVSAASLGQSPDSWHRGILPMPALRDTAMGTFLPNLNATSWALILHIGHEISNRLRPSRNL